MYLHEQDLREMGIPEASANMLMKTVCAIKCGSFWDSSINGDEIDKLGNDLSSLELNSPKQQNAPKVEPNIHVSLNMLDGAIHGESNNIYMLFSFESLDP